MVDVAIIMGSDSDMPVMAKAIEMLNDLAVSCDVRILSAHRAPTQLVNYVTSLKRSGFKVVIAGAGKAAALPGICAAHTILPVVGVPIKTSDLGGLDSLYSIVQMPTGVPVATVAINGAANAAILAAQIIALNNIDVARNLEEYRERQTHECILKDDKLREHGYGIYIP